MLRRLLLFACALPFAAACGDGGGPPPPGRDPGIDTTREGIIAFAESGAYRDWLAEPEQHPSAGPHGGEVRTYFNDVIADSLRAGNDVHPRGSILVKELYGSGTEVLGYAVNVKIEDGEGADTWLFWEGYGPEYGGDYYGVGLGLCAGCHSMGRDHVRSTLPE